MRILCSVIASILAISALESSQAKPNYSGVWKLESAKRIEILTIDHQEPMFNLKYKIEDNLGKRSFELKANTDGKEYEQNVLGSPATFVAKWDGNNLAIELKRIASYGPVHNRRILKLSEDGQTITTEKIDYSPDAKERYRDPETWKKQ